MIQISLLLSPLVDVLITLVSKSDGQIKFEIELLSNSKKQSEGILNAAGKSITDELLLKA